LWLWSTRIITRLRSGIATSTPAPRVSRARQKRLPRPDVSQRARALVRQQLANGPKPGAQVEAAAEAAEIPERSLIRAADALGVRTQRGQWWMPP
jgi:hypothetical protein